MGNRRLNIDKDKLVQLYVTENKSALEVSKILGCSVMAVFRRLQWYDIPAKSQSEVMKGRKLSKEARDKVIKTLRNGDKAIGADNPNWKGGRSWKGRDKDHRYVLRRVDGKYVPEHRYIMEFWLGRKLTPDEHVHHIDGNKINNKIENLRLMSATEHQKLHMTQEQKEYMSKKITEIRQKKFWSSKKVLD